MISKEFFFDIDRSHFVDHFAIEENLNSTLFPGGITGGVRYARGDVDQKHSFVVLVQASSSSEETLSYLFIGNTYTVFVDSSGPSAPVDVLQIQLEIIVFVKPHSLQFGPTKVHAANVDIEIWEGLYFETYNMQLISLQGFIIGVRISSRTKSTYTPKMGQLQATGHSLPQ